VHVASAGGVWSALVHGFGGMRDYGGVLSFDPRLPASWPEMRFRLTERGTRLRVTLRPEEIAFSVEEGQGLTVTVRGDRVSVLRGEDVVVPLADQGPRIKGAPDASAFHGTLRADGSVVTASLPAVVEQESDGGEWPSSGGGH
ncbi:glycosyl hydrolase family 65 protein, partial [Demequina sp.]|uniref:glycosyl hydrolase family 65 protein n=1 Tax=Demequina sp. TaxID=2050685 RepID=UPI0025EDD9FB